ncbi:Fe-S oxidoreductase [Leucobacter sp. GX24907]
MRLGVRWGVGSAPHPSVPEALHGAIDEAEQSHPTARSWTLTWLEGRPRCELGVGELDKPVLVSLDADGAVRLSDEPNAGLPQADGAPADDEDDDWLT